MKVTLIYKYIWLGKCFIKANSFDRGIVTFLVVIRVYYPLFFQ
jgi:hypothetical protein